MEVPGVFRDTITNVIEDGERYTVTTTEVSAGDGHWDTVKQVWRDSYGEVSREKGPAIKHFMDSDKPDEWFYMNERHRLDGPAIEYINPMVSVFNPELKNRYFIVGDEYTKEEFEDKLKEFKALKFDYERKLKRNKDILRNTFRAWNIEMDNPRNPTGRRRMIRRFEQEFPENPLQGENWPYMLEILEPEE